MMGCGVQETQDQIGAPEPLIVAYDATAAKGVTLGNEHYGYSYELLEAYAEASGREIRLQASGGGAQSKEKADVVISQHYAQAERGSYISEPLYSTGYVALASSAMARDLRKSGPGTLAQMFADCNIYVVPGFEHTKSYDMLLDSMKTSCIYVSAKGVAELVKGISPKERNILICEKSDASLISQMTKNVEQVYEFGEKVHMNALFAGDRSDLQQDFRAWYIGFQTTDSYAALEGAYMTGKSTQNAGKGTPSRSGAGTISIWDSLIRKVGERENVDWRLLSAIAYHESRFNADVVSKRGAYGLMQIMPVVAKHFKISAQELENPETNITVAAKLIKNIEKTLKLGGATKSVDRMSMILAAYNCGIGNVVNARKLAVKNGENPDSWQVVADYLCRMGDKDYVDSFDISRTFNGGNITLAYVDNVISKYRSYCNRVSR